MSALSNQISVIRLTKFAMPSWFSQVVRPARASLSRNSPSAQRDSIARSRASTSLAETGREGDALRKCKVAENAEMGMPDRPPGRTLDARYSMLGAAVPTSLHALVNATTADVLRLPKARGHVRIKGEPLHSPRSILTCINNNDHKPGPLCRTRTRGTGERRRLRHQPKSASKAANEFGKCPSVRRKSM